MATLRVMTMNMASGCGESYVDFTAKTHAAFINRVNPDVVFLQEVDRRTARAGGVDQLDVLRTSTALTNSHFVKWRNLEGGEYGVAVISRFPLLDAANRSFHKPASWWPYFIHQVITPVAYARIDVRGTPIHLYATHFPSKDADYERKRIAAAWIASTMPADLNTVFGGDFNDGPPSEVMAPIDAKFRFTEAIAVRHVNEVDLGLDHIYVSHSLGCTMWSRVRQFEADRQFSDHPMVYVDLTLPGEPVRWNWTDVGHANDVTALTASGGRLYCATTDNRLWRREPAGHDVDWTPLGDANNATALAALGASLYCITADNGLHVRPLDGQGDGWTRIGHANDVVGLAASDDKLYCATRDNTLWMRQPQHSDINWTPIGQAHDVRAMTGTGNGIICATGNSQIWHRRLEPGAGWQAVGSAPVPGIVGLAEIDGVAWTATNDNRLWRTVI